MSNEIFDRFDGDPEFASRVNLAFITDASENDPAAFAGFKAVAETAETVQSYEAENVPGRGENDG